MKIVYIHQYFRTPDQSGGTRSYEMARRLVQWGHEVHVVTSCTEPSERKSWFTEQIDGVNVHWLSVRYDNKMGFFSRLKAFFDFAIRSSRRAAKLQGDVVFATSTPLTIALPGVYASRKSNCPLVFEVRDLWPHVPIAMGVLRNSVLVAAAKLLERFAYRNSTHIVALSDGMAEGVVRAGVSAAKVTVIPNSADIALFDPDSIEAGVFRKAHPELPAGPILLYPGTLGRVNGVGYLAELAQIVAQYRNDIAIVVIGDGVERDSIESLARSNGTLGKNFFMYSPMPKKELVYAFRDAALVVSTVIDVPALEANSANKIFDAMAAGKAIAVNHGGWQKDLIREYDLGLALPRDLTSAAKCIVDFFESTGRVERCGLNAREMAVERYSRDLLAKRLEGILLAAVSEENKDDEAFF
ncbi:glycosyltransferase family 4 protein [Ectopseudomonas hydrolytica]|uniref:glycosyltransferase family 4 protein n=1 Tax=Ectopseudomonas hydrolytica TaxID=2493633 RepID=UPI003C2F3386